MVGNNLNGDVPNDNFLGSNALDGNIVEGYVFDDGILDGDGNVVDSRDGQCTGIRTSPLIFSFSPAKPGGSVRPNGLGWARKALWAPFR